MTDHQPKRETISSIEQIIAQATYEKIKDRIVAKQK